MDIIRNDPELGPESHELETKIQSIATTWSEGTVNIHTIACRQKKCAMYTSAESEQILSDFASALSEKEIGYPMMMMSGDTNSALITLKIIN